MNATLESSKAELHKIADRVREGIASGKYSLHEVQTAVVDKSKRAAAVTDAYVHENAWKSIGAAALAGIVVGALLARSGEEEEGEYEQVLEQPERNNYADRAASRSNFSIIETLQTALPLVLFGIKAYGQFQQRRRNKIPVM